MKLKIKNNEDDFAIKISSEMKKKNASSISVTKVNKAIDVIINFHGSLERSVLNSNLKSSNSVIVKVLKERMKLNIKTVNAELKKCNSEIILSY